MLLFQVVFQLVQSADKSYSPQQTKELFSKLNFNVSSDGTKSFVLRSDSAKVWSIKIDPREKQEPYSLTEAKVLDRTGPVHATVFKFNSDYAPVSVSKSKIFIENLDANENGRVGPLNAQSRNELNSILSEIDKRSSVKGLPPIPTQQKKFI